MENDLAPRFSALAHPQRLAVLGLLMRRHPDRVPAGEIGAAIGARPSTLSAYLADLTEAGLIDPLRRGTQLLYRARPEAVAGLVTGLADGICRGRVGLPAEAAPGRVRNVLFVCSGNSARSLMAEALLRDLDGARSEVFSAGIAPRDGANPQVMTMLAELGHETGALWPKAAATYLAADAPRMDVVVTLCNGAANAGLPAWPGRPVQAHWGLPDPVAEGTAEAYATTYLTLRARLERLAGLPAGLGRAEVQRALDGLAALGPEGV
jgi:ArsR family transcriptional regulator, arsenate/arsenite/antimonite-responsive transcriptional repressor / arsenate reductase (thioredoxin)